MIEDYVGRHAGADIFVIGSGKSLDYYPKGFFDNRTTIGINQGWANHLNRVDYMVTKYHENAIEWASSNRVGLVVVTAGQRGHRGPRIEPREGMLIVEHNNNPVERFGINDWPNNPLALVATHSSITTGMHFACLTNPRAVFVVGADCGDINGERTLTGHNPRQTTFDTLRSFDLQNTMVKRELMHRYDIPIVGLSPFVTPNMEGNRFESHAGALNVT